MDSSKRFSTTFVVTLGAIIVAAILILGTIWMGQSATRDTQEAVRSVSLFYLDELAGRREQVVASNLQHRFKDMQVAIELMTEEDLSDLEHLQAYQARMKRLYTLEKFAFVDTEGLIYTSKGMQDNIADYPIDYQNMTEPLISIVDLEGEGRKVILAMPVQISFGDRTLCVCFMEMDIQEMLSGVSMEPNSERTTFCNLYTKDGVALTDTVLGGLAVEDNLLEAMSHAQMEEGYSYEKFVDDFENLRNGEVSFTYNDIQETLSYVPVTGTDWMLTYLIRESVIGEQISSISSGIIRRSIVQTLLTIAALLALFAFVIRQNRENAHILLEKETAEAESRVQQQELERRLALQEQLLEQEKHREQQDKMISALAADYWSVYYIELDANEGVCYQSHGDLDHGLAVGERFPYLESVTAYANQYVTEAYRDEFLAFVQPDAVRAGLQESRVISYRYLVHRHGRESYEMARFAGVRQQGEGDDGLVHNVGACFTDVDAETRKQLAQNQALSDALEAAERASKAKTSFLSNMSHEIRTPMNAIIGLDNIALNDEETPEKTKGYLREIESSAEHLLNLINDILDMSRIESGRMVLKNEEFSLPRMLEAINTMFGGQCDDKGLEYRCNVKGALDAYYIGDDMKLRQVLINILGNAVKFTPKGGRVELEVERIARFDGKATLRFVVSDTGIGMSEEFLPHIFETFAQEDASSTNKYGSSGLGMPITKSLVEMMNGTIEVQSAKGEGTTFLVCVTLAESSRVEGDGDEDDIRPNEMSVLIVDDDPVACKHARLVLEKEGIASEVAQSGAEALELVRVRHARRDPYNLILVDWKMPEMDGVETTRQIRSIIGDDSAIVILTSYRWDDVLEEALQMGVDSFISKPLFAEVVMEEFRSAAKRKNLLAKDEAHKAELEGRRILLAEDVQVNATIMTMVLQMRQIETDLAENGKLAVEAFASHPEGYYDAILMDMRMPEMDGLEATRIIRAMDRADAKEIPIIALTANAFDEDVQRSLQAGLNAHLSKPVQPEALFETLESLIKD